MCEWGLGGWGVGGTVELKLNRNKKKTVGFQRAVVTALTPPLDPPLLDVCIGYAISRSIWRGHIGAYGLGAS